ncbi:MAG: two-component system phosphate regulon sensor histidine kinase PhoR [Polyangiales bacterium]|jgi:two-component system phosphate regulon sensor histidine kinase PhoR
MNAGGLRRSLVSAIVTAIGALVLVLLLLEDPLVEYRLRQLSQELLSDAATQVLEAEGGEGSYQEAASRVGSEVGCSLTVIRDERVIAHSAFPSPVSDGAIFDGALADFQASGTAHAELLAQHVYFARDGDVIVQASLPTTFSSSVRASVRELVIIGGIMAALVAVFLTYVLGRTLVEPARELKRVADALASGDLSARMESNRDDELGQIGHALGRMADILDDRINNLRGEQDRLRTVLDAMVEAVFVTDPLGRITETNAAFETLAGSEAVGKTSSEVFGHTHLHEAVRAARHQDSSQVEFEFEDRGNRYYLTAEVARLPDEAGVVVVLHDVSGLRHADRVRRDFVANASHELRTPLTAIRGFAETLRDGAIDDPAAATRFLDVILRHTRRLDALVGDLSALSKAESPEHNLAMERVDVEKAVSEVMRGLTSKAEERKIQLLYIPSGQPVCAWASHRGLDQVLVNLVDNAIKYAPEESAVNVTVVMDENVKVSVHNPGPGIAAVHHGRLFERFYRVDEGRSRDVGGTGLGLAIVKHLCTQMGASVGVKSAPGQGATFTVSLQIPEVDSGEEE